MVTLHELVDCGNTVIVVEHELRVIAQCDWVIDVGPGAGDRGGEIVACGVPAAIGEVEASRTGPYLHTFLEGSEHRTQRVDLDPAFPGAP